MFRKYGGLDDRQTIPAPYPSSSNNGDIDMSDVTFKYNDQMISEMNQIETEQVGGGHPIIVAGFRLAMAIYRLYKLLS